MVRIAESYENSDLGASISMLQSLDAYTAQLSCSVRFNLTIAD
jgi:hypothetical protein